MTEKLSDVIGESKVWSVKLADGVAYDLLPVNLGLMAKLEKELGCSITQIEDCIENAAATTILTMLCVFLGGHDLTREQIGKLVKPSMFGEISETLTSAITEGM